MKRYVYDSKGMTLLRIEEAEPECGDYCDSCGACLGCQGEDWCSGDWDCGPEHHWVVYEEAENEDR